MDDSILTEFKYVLPKELIAQTPVRPRDHARLLVYNRADGSISDDKFYNLGKYLPSDSTLVINNSKVDKARLKFDKYEIFVTEQTRITVTAMVFPGKKFKPGVSLMLAPGLKAEVVKVLDDGQRQLKLSPELDDKAWDKYRHTPFPPYIKPEEKYAGDYQTIYATTHGSVAAPTAGLHFTSKLIDQLKTNHAVAEVTLHVGLGTFAPLNDKNLKSGTLHQEWYQIDKAAAAALNSAKHITAVGTTSARVLESAVKRGKFSPVSSETQLFIRPGYKFKAVDALITNFHLPKSSLLMLVGAFMGVDAMQRVYDHAIHEKYRFYSFGDAMLIV